jgi:prolyl oligopeptidase
VRHRARIHAGIGGVVPRWVGRHSCGEFDVTTRQFVPDGFTVPEAKRHIVWENENAVLVATDFGAGSLTDSGYPRQVKRWRRGTRLAHAETLYSGSNTDVLVAASVHRAPGYERTLIQRRVDFFNGVTNELRGGELVLIDTPTDAALSLHRQWMLVGLKTDWLTTGTTYSAGPLLVADYEGFLAGHADWHVVFERDPRSSLIGGMDTGPFRAGNPLRRREPRGRCHAGHLAG